jgi:hypothetical protein
MAGDKDRPTRRQRDGRQTGEVQSHSGGQHGAAWKDVMERRQENGYHPQGEAVGAPRIAQVPAVRAEVPGDIREYR